MTKKTPDHELSSGNVFADLGLPDARELQAKAELAYEISRTIDQRGLTQVQAAALLGVDQPKVSALVRGRLDGFSMERLYRFLNALGKDVEILVRPASARRASANLRVVTITSGQRAPAPAKVRQRSGSRKKRGAAQ
jgi:predicted XRE-type DNA-binding protein